ncbi:hypothetical protein PR202_ga07688 [Eleusine coracana subsp. coracana]|uniref:Protein kinase domain-containing protein n=1 Tax=Eleusine coracana subsp. coracana TaxID=191504 RepID=A0AAV5C084_ELECO|nr:hypothetical protein PR202_ga07688 [Eleusine coracana subsp. coracana]
MSTVNDDETSSTTTESMFYISPNGEVPEEDPIMEPRGAPGERLLRDVFTQFMIDSYNLFCFWMVHSEGVFFAVKEVSLYDQGSNAKQCIFQLEQEIALLSQFEHENIVQYYGTDKVRRLETLHLPRTSDPRISCNTVSEIPPARYSCFGIYKTILHGLIYLHERNIVHR